MLNSYQREVQVGRAGSLEVRAVVYGELLYYGRYGMDYPVSMETHRAAYGFMDKAGAECYLWWRFGQRTRVRSESVQTEER